MVIPNVVIFRYSSLENCLKFFYCPLPVDVPLHTEVLNPDYFCERAIEDPDFPLKFFLTWTFLNRVCNYFHA
jgi:hypothetical protein